MQSRASERPFVIVGGGVAGGNAAATLRDDGFTGRVLLISKEHEVPFGRPPLSKTYLRSEEDLDGWYVRPAAWYAQHDVELVTGTRVTGLDVSARKCVLDSGRELEYDKLLVATGGRNRHLEIPGSELSGIHYLRTVAECDAIKAEVRVGSRAVIVGMGFIGCEVAASLTQLGVQVTGVLPGRIPLARALGDDVGALVGRFHRENGVELLAGEQVASFEGTERVQRVVTASGIRLPCDFVVVGVGITAEIPAFTGPALDTQNGILADERCRASVADVYAAGDVANQLHPLFGRVRVEHFNNAEKQGRAAARSMLGSHAPYDYIHTFWSDQYDHTIEYVGHATKWDDFAVRGSIADGRFIGFYLLDGTVLAAVSVDRGGDPETDHDGEMAACSRLVASRARPANGSLTSEGTDLWSLVQ
jgi:3-phenylpropionate/trans-cinnamate dioxygenase ferredoxin reductase component